MVLSVFVIDVGQILQKSKITCQREKILPFEEAQIPVEGTLVLREPPSQGPMGHDALEESRCLLS